MAEAVGVVGSGIMGAGIAEVAARAGCDVLIREVTPELADAGRARIATSLGRAVTRGKLSEADRDATLGRVRVTTELSDLADRDLVIEAIVEDEAVKTALYAELGTVVRPDTVLASNTSSIPISRLAAVTPGPERVLGMHFFNPVPVLPLVELVPSLLTGADTVARAQEFAAGRLGKKTVLCKDRSGFVVNALLVPYILAAVRMVEAGVASAEDVDTAMVGGANHPMGPLALADLIGLDTTAAIAGSLYEEYKEPLYAAPPLLRRMVEAGLLGRKSGRGFHDYS
ncbi:MAG: 3-hydroxybutyryl-CoA dehydrogenase; 3-hydroxyacyl-CoA dehydrogenase [uncultured Corynebacteriales bacterium]|uniref:3-hydroxybutyryl-CoA dehydrogenase 3-hydroxyacyl-CoA dehydrogenase n=1 Tax=uncultured Mycobacteriales bacterium TaxID=581187 RepID=A0A6J4JTD5_9ACTN|nr:MAG: 3-hydroxybutyryl-CoA dehydrogenase; 3-hydroxyacyl-CoA dehydrogenase [uncultured Corynebacteriales bacterium]